MSYKVRVFIGSLFIISLLSIMWVSNPADADEQDYYLRLKKGWQYMQKVYENLNQHYVEEVDPYPLMKAGINGMLEKLDPYTVFLEEDGERRLQIITTGKYGGLGMEIGLRNKKVTVIAPIDNTPAKKIGIQAGDIIEKINGKEISGWSVNEVSDQLRGKIGTEVTLEIRRPGLDAPYSVTLTRAEIVIEDVGYAGFVEPGVAYLRLTGFTEKASDEMKTAIRNLQNEQDIRAFILDLRGNPGGLLDAAVDVVNIFVDKNEMVVYTKGYRESETKFYTKKAPLLPDVPLAVLVDQGSASASEIVAGAFQDLDRAVIIGESTYGKGLVQKVYSIDNNEGTKLKITTARYYIPSGRCIQKTDYGNKNDVFIRDSLMLLQSGTNEFYTRNKRKVEDKGGIYPDIKVASDSISYITMELIRKSLIFDYAVKFHHEHAAWQPDTQLADSVLTMFKKYIQNKKVTFDIEGERELDKLEKIASTQKYSDNILMLIKELKKEIAEQKESSFKNHADEIAKVLNAELTEKYLGNKERDRILLSEDDPVLEAVSILKNDNRYDKILALN
ncbi:MAG: S41 family peptidase [Calditrichaceae bacterium]|nr:S41 family peptidase [Calditrichaceae bacterium]HES59103.1 S41 family peptidase [Caldithrix sp.]